jgi:hypothetical protein
MDDQRFDEIAKFLAAGFSRRRMLRGLAASAAGTLLVRLTGGGASAANDCANFCQLLPPGPERGRCVSDCAQGGGGLFGQCQGDPARLCAAAGGTAVCCPPDQVCAGGVCQCPTGAELCGGACLPACTGGKVRNPANCGCDCPTGTELCGGQCYAPCDNNLVRRLDCTCSGACCPGCPGGRACNSVGPQAQQICCADLCCFVANVPVSCCPVGVPVGSSCAGPGGTGFCD